MLHDRASAAPHNPPRQNWLARIAVMMRLRKSRRDLSRLNEDQLFDIGLTHDQVETELQRRIWDVPPHWRHR